MRAGAPSPLRELNPTDRALLRVLIAARDRHRWPVPWSRVWAIMEADLFDSHTIHRRRRVLRRSSVIHMDADRTQITPGPRWEAAMDLLHRRKR